MSEIKIGTKVRTADPLTACGSYEATARAKRRAGVVAEAYRFGGSGHGEFWWCSHEDGSEAPYDAEELTPIEALKLGQRVRTAKELRPAACFARAIEVTRRPDALGEVYGAGPEGAYWLVEHADRTRAPYFPDELAPIPDEKAAPTTPIGRLRDVICNETGASLFVDQWERIDVALREVEGEIASLRAVPASDEWEVHGPMTGALARLYPNPDAWHDLETEDRSRVWSALRWLVNEVKGEAIAEVAPLRADGAEVDRLRAIEATRVDEIEAVLQRHAAAVGTVGPMPVEKAAEPWAGVVRRIERSTGVGAAADLAKPDPWLPVKVATPEPVKAARPRVGPWVQSGPTWCAYDDRGVQVAFVWQVGAHYAWWAARPFLGNKDAGEKTEAEAKAAAVAVLSTWADVEGAEPAAAEADRYVTVAHVAGDSAQSIHDGPEASCTLCHPGMATPPATVPPLSLVVAFGSEGAPVVLEARGPWEGIEDRPSPPARGLWRWVGKAIPERDELVGGHDFEGVWTLLPVPS